MQSTIHSSGQPAATHAGAERQPAAARTRPRLLVCDDEPQICEFLSRVIGDLGQCDTACNGEDALAQINTHRYDLLLLDIKMPKLDGLRVLELLRQTQRPLRVIVLTAYQELDVAEAAHRTYSLMGYLTKPIQVGELHAVIEHALAQSPQLV